MASNANRRKSREVAVQLLYQADLNPNISSETELEFLEREIVGTGLRQFTRELVAGVRDHLKSIDLRLRTATRNWHVYRMAAIDRAILRLGAYEILHRDDIPYKVAINEAIEIAKRFSAVEAPAFVNGVLDQIAKFAPSRLPRVNPPTLANAVSPADAEPAAEPENTPEAEASPQQEAQLDNAQPT